MVRVAAVAKVIEQEPDGALPVQLSPVLATTVIVPLGMSVSPLCGLTEKLIVTACPTSAGFGKAELITVELFAFTPVPLRETCCIAPEVPPLLSVRVRVPLAEPRAVGTKARFSVQLLPGLMEAPAQFWVVVNGDAVATPEICIGAFPTLLIVTA